MNGGHELEQLDEDLDDELEHAAALHELSALLDLCLVRIEKGCPGGVDATLSAADLSAVIDGWMSPEEQTRAVELWAKTGTFPAVPLTMEHLYG